MALELYRKKRNFSATPEPKGKLAKPKRDGLAFVIQKHAATRLHYDFRLELNGVLLSWAVPKGPSLDPNDKRLAMHVEDHPIEYGEFEGIIPAKQYGAGTVMLWDRGTWIPKEDPVAGYKKGKLKFDLEGEKLRGGWTLVKSRGSKYSGDAWLLFKEDDEYARTGPEARIVDDRPNSVATQRDLKQIAADPGRVWHSNKSVAENVKSGVAKKAKVRIDPSRIAGSRKAALPEFINPQLATARQTAPTGNRWIHEVKLDGYRMLCRIEDGRVQCFSRNRRQWTKEFPHIVRVLADLPVKNAWIDGEVVSLDAKGRSSFQALQNALSTGNRDTLYYVFDLPYLNGYDLRGVALEKRKALLERLVQGSTIVRFSGHFNVTGEKFLTEVRNLGLEGMISKLRDSTYQGTRGDAWLKIKCGRRQEFVIGGFTDPEGSRQGFGALLLGVYDAEGKLHYSGKVGTGFNDSLLVKLRKTLDELVQDKPPFVNPPEGAEGRRAHWTKPELVADVSFTEWTHDAILRNPSFQGLRADKSARDVVREDSEKTPELTRSESELQVPRDKGIKTAAKNNDKATVAGIKLTNSDKLLYPEAGITKRDLALYYEAVGEWILPHLRNRPLTLVRCPNGWNKESFYQKHADQNVPDVIERVEVEDSDGPALYMMANSLSALVAMAQMGALELHPWGSRAPRLGFPDRIILDIDPDEALEWKEIAEAAHLLKTLLDELGLRGFLKTTGGKGLHVVLPIEPVLPWNRIKGFSQAIAELFAQTFPDRFTAKILKLSRRGKIFIDYLRNGEGSTAVAAYSTRARANGPVSTPIDWEEITRDVRFDHFNVKNVPARLKRLKRDPWAEFLKIRQSITKEMMKRVGYTE
ncbi:MAG TPA: DNA ligase D [Candidatus Binatia bacterium]|nr:DNA ligase D [Candidatus Binatia bacterium]